MWFYALLIGVGIVVGVVGCIAALWLFEIADEHKRQDECR